MSGRAGNVRGALERAGQPVVRQWRSARRRVELHHALRTIRRVRGARLVLNYHRVLPKVMAPASVVPTIGLDLFRAHVTALRELGEIVPLEALIQDETDRTAPVRFALTFDDDYASHVCHVLPVLRACGVHGTFFLSGRSLHGLGGYWFERLEALIAERGTHGSAVLLGLERVDDVAQWPLICETDARRQSLIQHYAPRALSSLDAEGIRALIRAGMTVGFHTLRHPVLPSLLDEALGHALIEGRDRLGALVGAPLNWLAYPHGKTDARTVIMTRYAGYTAAWTTDAQLLCADDDPLRYGRWSPRPMQTDDLVVSLAVLLQTQRYPCV